MSHSIRRLTMASVFVAAAAYGPHEASALGTTTIIGDGDNLVAAVAAAQNGDVIEIRSNQTFLGAISWSNKFLTIQAGDGYAPTIKGEPYTFFNPPADFGRAAFEGASGGPGSGALFRGVAFQPGVPNPVRSPPFDKFKETDFFAVIEGGTSDLRSQLTFQDCDFKGGVVCNGTGEFQITANFEDNRFLGSVAMVGTGGLVIDADFTRNRFVNSGLGASGTGSMTANVLAVNNVFVGSTNPAPLTGISFGAFSQAKFSGRFLNNTIVGYQTGIAGGSNSKLSFENMLLQNLDDVDIVESNVQILNSLIADGTFNGQGGNFAGSPLLGTQQQLLAGSLGIDRGNNGALGLPSTDAAGRPRILDGDGDGIARVDVGAFEFAIPEPNSAVVILTAWTAACVPRGRPRGHCAARGAQSGPASVA